MNIEQHIKQKFNKALRNYNLISQGDRILVGLSGGKDSLCLLELLAQRSKIFHPQFIVEALHVRMENIKYESNTHYLETFCESLGVKLHVITTSFNEETPPNKRKKPECFLCSWARRKVLFRFAQDHNFNKIALGHHQDDIIHTTLMNLFYESSFSAMPISLKYNKMPITLIRPLCIVREDDIRSYAALRGYEPLLKACPFEHDTIRTTISQWYRELETANPEIRYSVWKAIERSALE